MFLEHRVHTHHTSDELRARRAAAVYSNSAGKELAEELRMAGAMQGSSGSTTEIVTVHENDPERGGCEFGICFDGRTPKDLVDGGIYNVRALFTVYCAVPHGI